MSNYNLKLENRRGHKTVVLYQEGITITVLSNAYDQHCALIMPNTDKLRKICDNIEDLYNAAYNLLPERISRGPVKTNTLLGSYKVKVIEENRIRSLVIKQIKYLTKDSTWELITSNEPE